MELTAKQIVGAWDGDEAGRKARLKAALYYDGEQAILKKLGARKDGKPYSKTAMNWIANLVDRHVGFNLGKPAGITLPDEVDMRQTIGLDSYDTVRNESDLDSVDAELFRDALICGYGVEVHSFDGENPVISRYSPLEWCFTFNTDGGLESAVRRLEVSAGTVYEGEILAEDTVLWWAYDERNVARYRQRSERGAARAELEEVERKPHFYGRPPVVLFRLNAERTAFVSGCLIGLQDGYNATLSSHLDDHEADIDSLLAMYGLNPSQLTEKDPESGQTLFEKMRAQGAIAFPDKDSGAEFITRGLATEKTQFTETLLRRLIHDAGKAPDLTEITGATGATSGIALKLRFRAMEEAALGFAKYVRISIKERIDLLNAIWRRTGKGVLEDYDVSLSLTVLTNEVEIWGAVGALEPLLSRVDRARLVPSIEDPDQAIRNKEDEEAQQGAAQGQSLGEEPQPGAAVAQQPGAGATQAEARAMALSQKVGDFEGLIGLAADGLDAEVAAVLAESGVRVTPDELQRIIEELLALLRARKAA
jgi:SPP1 family phage portal protein